MANSPTLDGPPRFANKNGPNTPSEWAALNRWFNNLFKFVSASVSSPLAIALQQPPYRVSNGATGSGVALYLTHTVRLTTPASGYLPGQILEESDTGYQYIGNGTDWIWQSGLITDTSNTLAGKPTWLTTTDAKALYRNSYFCHVWMWDGAAWNYFTGEVGAGAQVSTSGSAPEGGLWAACDGGSYTAGLNNCTTGTVTASDTRVDGLGNNPAIMGGAGGPQDVATAASWDTGAKTDDESAHTHSVSIAATGSATGPIIGVDFAQAQTVTSGPGTAHHHTLSNANAPLKPPSDVDGGMPLRVSMKWWIRL